MLNMNDIFNLLCNVIKVVRWYLDMILPATFKFCILSQLRRGSEITEATIHWKIQFFSWDSLDMQILSMEVKNILLLRSYLNWKSCWQTNWVQQDTAAMLAELNLWCYFLRGLVSLDSYTPQCSQDHVFLWGIKWTIRIITNRHFWRL